MAQAMKRFGGARLVAAMLGLGLGGCYSTGDGPDPAPNELYFPVGLAVSPGGRALYVANSDFDLQFNGGTVEAYDLESMREALRFFWAPQTVPAPADVCQGLGPNPTPVVQPGPCGPFNPKPFVKASAKIGAFATDILYACRPSADPMGSGTDCQGGTADASGARLFLPVRGDPSLTFLDVDDDRGGAQNFRLDCGQQSNNGRCTDSFRAGIDPNDNTRALTLPAEPFGIAIAQRGDAMVITHQTTGGPGAASLFVGRDSNGTTLFDAKPRLEFVLGGLAAPATGITALPIPAAIIHQGFAEANYQPGFALTYRGAPQVDVLRFFDDAFAAPKRPFLQRTGAFGLSATPSGADSRDVIIDHSPTTERAMCESDCRNTSNRCVADCASAGNTATCEEGCNTDRLTCEIGCARIPVPAYVSSRTPPALLIGEMRMSDPTRSSESLSFYDSIPLTSGASRVVMGRVHDRRDPPGVYRTRVFVVCFDARVIIIYDPVERRVEGQIRTGRGPHALVMDPQEPIAYVGHFTDSYIGLIDLDQSHNETFGSIVATIGVPTPPKGS